MLFDRFPFSGVKNVIHVGFVLSIENDSSWTGDIFPIVSIIYQDIE